MIWLSSLAVAGIRRWSTMSKARQAVLVMLGKDQFFRRHEGRFGILVRPHGVVSRDTALNEWRTKVPELHEKLYQSKRALPKIGRCAYEIA